MPNQNELAILISAKINTGKAIGDINAALKGLEQKINKLKLKIEVPENFGINIASFINSIEKLKNTTISQNKLVEETISTYKKLDGTIVKVTNKYYENGEGIENVSLKHDKNKKSIESETEAIVKQTKALDEFLDEHERFNQEISRRDKFLAEGDLIGSKLTLGERGTANRLTANLDAEGNVTGFEIAENILKNEQQLLKFKQLSEEMSQKLMEIGRQGKVSVEQLNRIGTAITNSRNIKELQELEVHLKNLADQTKKQIQLDNFRETQLAKIADLQRRFGKKIDTEGLENLRNEIKNLSVASPDFEKRLKEIPNQLKLIGANAQTASSHVLRFGEAFSTALIKFPVWMLATTTFFAPLHALQSGVTYIRDFDDALTELLKVVDLNNNQIKEMTNSAIELGKELGKSSVDIMQAFAEFGRQFKDTEEIVSVTRAAVLASNVTTLSAAEAAKTLTTAMISFGISAKDSMSIIDSMNEIQNNYRVSAEDLADSLSKVGNMAKLAGSSMQSLEGITTAIVAATGISGNEAGTAIKGFISRLFRLGEEGEEDAGKSEELLRSLGIEIRKTATEYKSFDEILKEINAKWSSWGSITKQNVAQTIGSQYHVSKFIALMDNFQMSLDATNTALHSQGSAMRENQVYLDSITGKWEVFKTTLQEQWQNAINSDFIKNVVVALTYLVDTFGNLATVVTYTGVILAAWKGKAVISIIKDITTSLISATKTFPAYVMGLGTAKAATVGLEVTTSRAKIAVLGLGQVLKTNWFGLLLSGVTLAITAFDIFNQRQEDAARKAEESIQKLKQESIAIEDLQRQYIDIIESGNLTAESKNQLKTIQEQLIETYGLEANAIDLINGKYEEQIKLIDSAIVKRAEEAKRIRGARAEEARNKLNEQGKLEIEFFPIEFKDKRLDILKEFQEKFGKEFTSGFFDTNFFTGSTTYNINGTLERRIEIYGQLLDRVQELAKSDKAYIGIANDMAAQYSNLKTKLEEYQKILREDISDEFTIKFSEELSKLRSLSEQLKVAPDNTKVIDQVNALRNSMIQLADSMGRLEDFKPLIDAQFESFNAGITSANTNTIDLSKTIKSLTASYSSVRESIEPLNQILRDLDEGKQANIETIFKLIESEEGFINAISIENGQLVINRDTVVALRDAKIQSFKDTARIQEQQLEAQEKVLIKELEGYGLQVEAIKSVVEAKTAILGIDKLIQEQAEVGGADFPVFLQQMNKMKEEILGVGKAWETIEKLKQLVSSGLSKNTSTKSGPQLKDAIQEQNLIKERINSFNAEYEIRQKIIESIERQIKLAGKQKDYNKQIEQTNELINQQKRSIEDLENAQKNITAEAQAIRDKNPMYDTESWFDVNNQATEAYREFLNSFAKRSQEIRNSSKLSIEQKNKEIDALQDEQKKVERLFDDLAQLKQAWDENTNRIYQMKDAIDASVQSLADLKFEAVANSIRDRKDLGLLSLRDELLEWQELLKEFWDQEGDSQEALVIKAQKRLEIAKTIHNLEIQIIEENEKRAEELAKKQEELDNNRLNSLKKIADIIVDTYKEALEKQRDLQLKNIENMTDAEDKRHDARMKNLDDEMKRFEDVINEQLKLIDRESEAEDYAAELKRKQDEAQKIQSQIDALKLDDSIEAQAKRRELEEELRDKTLEIEKFKKDRTKQLRKEALQDSLDQKKKEVDAAKAAEDKMHNDFKERLEKDKEAAKAYWEGILEDDVRFTQMQEDIINNHLDQVLKDMNEFKDSVGDIATVLGQAISDSLNAKLQQSINLLNQLKVGNIPNIGGITTPSPSNDQTDNARKMAHEAYVNNKLKWQAIYNATGRTDTEEQLRLQKENDAYRKQFGFRDYDYEDIINGNIERFKTGGYTADSQGLAWLDKKELVLNDMDTSNILKAVDLVRSITSKISNFENFIKPKTSLEGGNKIINFNINIENVNGPREAANSIFSEIKKGVQTGRFAF